MSEVSGKAVLAVIDDPTFGGERAMGSFVRRLYRGISLFSSSL